MNSRSRRPPLCRPGRSRLDEGRRGAAGAGPAGRAGPECSALCALLCAEDLLLLPLWSRSLPCLSPYSFFFISSVLYMYSPICSGESFHTYNYEYLCTHLSLQISFSNFLTNLLFMFALIPCLLCILSSSCFLRLVGSFHFFSHSLVHTLDTSTILVSVIHMYKYSDWSLHFFVSNILFNR